MLSEPQQTYLTQAVRTMQIIALALIFGVIVFGLVALLGGFGAQETAETPLLAIIAAVVAMIAVVAAPLISKLIATGMRQSVVAGKRFHAGGSKPNSEAVGEVGSLVAIYQVQQIISRAILEGAAFMNLAAYMTERQPMSLAFAMFLLIAMFFKFPTRGHLEKWVGDEMTTIEQLRSLEN
jgi:hypothetical protein